MLDLKGSAVSAHLAAPLAQALHHTTPLRSIYLHDSEHLYDLPTLQRLCDTVLCLPQLRMLNVAGHVLKRECSQRWTARSDGYIGWVVAH